MLADNDCVLFRLRQRWFCSIHTSGHFPTPGAPDIKQLTSGTTVVYYDTASDYSYIPSSVYSAQFDLASSLPARASAHPGGPAASKWQQERNDGKSSPSSIRRTTNQSPFLGS